MGQNMNFLTKIFLNIFLKILDTNLITAVYYLITCPTVEKKHFDVTILMNFHMNFD